MTTYILIRPPFTLRFDEMSKEELINYNSWFHGIMQERTEVLTNAVRTTSGYEDWNASFSPDSLEYLGQWFEKQVSTRPKTQAEIQPIAPHETHELDDRTFSICMDVGMYFAQVILRNLTGTTWAHPLKNKKFADYGQPVVMGFGTIPLNPIRVIVMTAYGIARGKPANLKSLYDTWSKLKK